MRRQEMGIEGIAIVIHLLKHHCVRVVLCNCNVEGEAAGFMGDGRAGIVVGERQKGRHGARLHRELGDDDKSTAGGGHHISCKAGAGGAGPNRDAAAVDELVALMIAGSVGQPGVSG